MDRVQRETPPPPPNPGPGGASLHEVKAAGQRWGLDEFVAVVNGLVDRYLPAKRGFNVKLRDAFNPRLVRYYATFGLISPPEREGKAARYHYGHLLQALVIRRLLFEGYTAPALLKMLAGKKEPDYEAMLAGGISTAAAKVPREDSDGPAGADGSFGDQRLARELAADPPPVSDTPLPEAPLWRRAEIAPGLELHVRADFVAPDTRAGRESLLRAVLARLGRGDGP